MAFSRLALQSTPKAHLVLGSGLGNPKHFSTALKEFKLLEEKTFSELGLIPASAPEHRGSISLYGHSSSSLTFSIQWGRLHLYEGNSAKDVIAPLEFMRSLGVKNFILTNAAGSLISKSAPGDVMLISDHINATGHNPLSMRELPEGVEGRFHDMTAVYDRELAMSLEKYLLQKKLLCHRGVYLGLPGPTFETPAEIQSFKVQGAHAVGMSTVLEAIYLKACRARVCGLSLLSNMACGTQSEVVSSTPDTLSAEEVFATADSVGPRLAESLIQFILQERSFHED